MYLMAMNKDFCLDNKKISIIIPVYNIKDLLSVTLRSVIKQTYENLEIILVDDGSTDGSDEVCDFWETQDPRIKCFHKKNEGVSVARNFGFSKSTGDYILFIDGDDEINLQMCEKLLAKILTEDADLCYCGYENIFSDETIVNIPRNKTLEGVDIENALVSDLAFFTAIWNKLFKREVLLDKEDNFISFDQRIYVGEDELWLSRVLKNTKKVTAVSDVLYFWKRRENSATKGGNVMRTNEKYLSVLEASRGVVLELQDRAIKSRRCKKYLGLTRDCMIQAYKEENEILTKKLVQILEKDKSLYGKFDIFMFKLNICLFMVKSSFPISMVEAIQSL